MMDRAPTPLECVYAWHRQAIDDQRLGIEINVTLNPECGWFKRRLVKGGVFVPARIWIEAETDADTGELISDEVMICEVGGRREDPSEAWTWLCANPITEAEFNYLTATARHIGWHEPDQPQANPRQPIDWLTVRPPNFATANRRHPA